MSKFNVDVLGVDMFPGLLLRRGRGPVIAHLCDERDERQMDQRQTGKQVSAGIITRAGTYTETGDQ